MAFPTSLDSFGDVTDNVDDVEASDINNIQDAVEAIEAKIGIDGSVVATSIDFFIRKNYVKVSDSKTNAAGGGFGASAWRTRDINTENSDDGGLCSLSGNQLTLAAGTYRCRITCPAFLVDSHCARLFNVSNQTELIRGTVEFCEQSAYGEAQTRSEIVGQFSIAAAQLLEIQHFCTNSKTGDGFGVRLFSTENVYTVAEFWKLY